MKYLSAIIISIAGITCAIPPVIAQDTPSPTDKKVNKPAPKKTVGKKKEAAAEDVVKDSEIEGMAETAYDCELGNKLSIYSKAEDDQQITLRWNKRLHHMSRVSTTTGAHCFENTKNGLVWIGIPAKGMLLDSKKGLQLANECKNAEQAMKKD